MLSRLIQLLVETNILLQEDQSLCYFVFYCSLLIAAIGHIKQTIQEEKIAQKFQYYVVENTHDDKRCKQKMQLVFLL